VDSEAWDFDEPFGGSIVLDFRSDKLGIVHSTAEGGASGLASSDFCSNKGLALRNLDSEGQYKLRNVDVLPNTQRNH
jgi:hypothetical protein